MSLPTITVLMSTYNGEKYLRQQLDSILCQQDVEVKVLIRDDGSTDETKCILEEYSQYNENIKVYEAENVGAKQSFLELVNDTDTDTEYYAFCDQDDIWLERKLISAIEKILHYDAERPRLYYSRVKRVGENLEQLSNVFEKHYHTERFGAVLVNRAAPGCTMVWDRCTMKYLRMYRPQIFYMHDSWTLQVCLAVNGVAIYDDNSYILYRQHGSNVIGGLKKMKKSKLQLFVYRVKKFLDFSYDYNAISEQLLTGYSELMSDENRKLCELIVSARKSWRARLKILFSRELRTPYFVINLKFRIRVLVNKL